MAGPEELLHNIGYTYCKGSSQFALEFRLGSRINHEMALEFVYGVHFRCDLHHYSSLSRFKGSWGQLWPKTGPNQQNMKTKTIISPRGLTATESRVDGRVNHGSARLVFDVAPLALGHSASC